ncbi:MAG: sulfatase-like hydrolase/transferase [Bryobacterales bacterium]|nr:sulfatase-like hydrolase/transferase [Bryobacterales bacterium]
MIVSGDRHHFSRRGFLRATGFAAGAAAQTMPGARKPNVLFILTDDQRQDTVHARGNAFIQTPNLDGIVRSGVSFGSAYCMGGFSPAVCLPSRMMIHRGRSWFSVREQPKEAPNFARSMNRAGYVTCRIGKRNNEDIQSHQSFTFNTYVDQEETRAGTPGKLVADRAVEFLRGWTKDPALGRGNPFFLHLAGPAPHDPRIAPPEYVARYDVNKIPLPPNYKPYHPFDNGELLIRDEKLAPWPRTETEIRRHLRDYYAVITYMDEQLGRVFSALKEIGEYDNTILVFTGDQGIAIGSHGLMGKQNLYEHSMNAGITIAGPGIPRGNKANAFAYLFDIFPTICDLVGAPIPSSLEGKSLVPILRGQAASVRDTIFLAYRDVQRAVRRGDWKLLRYPKINLTQLFNLRRDPYETRDLSTDSDQADRIEELTALMQQQQRLFGDTASLTSENPGQAEVDLQYFNH